MCLYCKLSCGLLQVLKYFWDLASLDEVGVNMLRIYELTGVLAGAARSFDQTSQRSKCRNDIVLVAAAVELFAVCLLTCAVELLSLHAFVCFSDDLVHTPRMHTQKARSTAAEGLVAELKASQAEFTLCNNTNSKQLTQSPSLVRRCIYRAEMFLLSEAFKPHMSTYCFCLLAIQHTKSSTLGFLGRSRMPTVWHIQQSLCGLAAHDVKHASRTCLPL